MRGCISSFKICTKIKKGRCFMRQTVPICLFSSVIQKKQIIDFSDSKNSYKSMNTWQLLRGQLVFMICQLKPLVSNAESFMKLSYNLFGLKITNYVLKLTFFGHFCAGEDQESIKPTVLNLEKHGVGSILDYAAESDITTENDNIDKYEELCDMHAETFIKCIQSVKSVSPTGFAAIKITALGNPILLERISKEILELNKLFSKMDKNKTGFVTKEQFYEVFGKQIENRDVSVYFDNCDVDHDGRINYLEWTNGIPLEQLHLITDHCTTKGPLAAAVLNEKELLLFRNMRKRIDNLAYLAQSLGVRLMIDAEHSYFQPAIDNITLALAKRFNQKGSTPVIFSTYQLYLKDSSERFRTDMERARLGNYTFAAKLVRGAYMVLERDHAKQLKLPDPIHNDYESTDNNYNSMVELSIERIAAGDQVEIMIATHNQRSVELALLNMNKHSLGPSAPIYFGQLLGMSDHLTFSVGSYGYKAYKYVPYGKVEEVMPYLIRRAQENSGALSNANYEMKLLWSEIKRRLFSTRSN
eukprot:gene11537-15453_t